MKLCQTSETDPRGPRGPIHHRSPTTRRAPLVLGLLVGAMLSLAATEGQALPGTHGISVSNWDLSASSIVFAFRNGFMLNGGHLRIASYNANFSSTSGRISAQFGLHYLNFSPDKDAESSHGISGTAVGVLALPVTKRYDNGLAKVAFNLYLGGAPAALIGGVKNYMTIPVVAGVGLAWSPLRQLSIIPWGELAPSLNVDTVIKEYSGDLGDGGSDPEQSVTLEQAQVEDVVAESVETEVSGAFRVRAGLTFAIHIGDRVDLQVVGAVANVGEKFNGPVAIFVGGGLAIAWDDPVPGVLPVEKRLENISCVDIEARAAQCVADDDEVETPPTDAEPEDPAAGTADETTSEPLPEPPTSDATAAPPAEPAADITPPPAPEPAPEPTPE
jgi:hypothetical protein